jgi:hypothetical protein
MNAAGQLVPTLVKGAVTGAGIYYGSKVLTPALNAARPAIAQTARSGASFVSNTAKSALNTGSKGISGFFNALSKPVSSLPKVGVVAAVAGAGALGYGVGTLFNKTSAGQALQSWSSQQGAKVGASNNIISQALFPHATLNTSKTDASFAKLGLTTAQVQANIAAGRNPLTGARTAASRSTSSSSSPGYITNPGKAPGSNGTIAKAGEISKYWGVVEV